MLCAICGKNFVIETKKALDAFCKHVGKCPILSTNELQERFQCSLCKNVVKLNHSFKNHILKDHLPNLKNPPANSDTPTTSRVDSGKSRSPVPSNLMVNVSAITPVYKDVTIDEHTMEFTPNTTNQSFLDSNNITYSDLKKNMLLISSRIFGRMNMSMDAAEDEMRDVHEFNNMIFLYIQSSVKEALKDFREAQEKVIDCLVTTEKRVDTALKSVSTEQKLKTQLQKVDALCFPKTKIVGGELEQTGDDLVTKRFKVTILPIAHQIRQFLGKQDVLKSILECQDKLEKENNGNITHFLNASRWKAIKSKFEGKIVVPIYNDDFGPDDTLSPHGKNNKISGYYYNFPTLPAQMASTIESIFVALLGKAKDIQVVGVNNILKLLVKELEPLEKEGIQINGKTVHIAPVLLCGDNLGLNLNLGVIGFKGKYHCRTCFMPKDRMETCCKEDERLIRTKEHYEKCIAELDQGGEAFGIKFKTYLNFLLSFDFPLSMIVDIMHDLLSGVMVYGLVGLLKKGIDTKRFTLKKFNDVKSKFDYGTKYKNSKFGNITNNNIKNNTIRCHAREMWTLIKFLPAILSQLLPVNCPLKKFGVILSELLDLCMKTSYSKDDLSKLEACVIKHNQEFLKLFNTNPSEPRPLPPKAHNLLHYVRIIQSSGPLRKMWSMRFEAKHQQAKSYAKVCHSRRNFCYSMGKKYCYHNAFIILKNDNNLKKISEFKRTHEHVFLLPKERSSLKCCKSVRYKGTHYFVGDYILSRCTKTASKILAIGVDVLKDEIVLVTGSQEVTYSKNLRLYRIIKNLHINETKNIDDFVHPPTSLIRFNGHFYIPPEDF